MLQVNEIFYSLQGEGYNTGTASVFVRLSGCNLRCNFCDTSHQQGTPMTLQQIAREVNRWPDAPLLVLTGGEPSLWLDDDTVAQLKESLLHGRIIHMTYRSPASASPSRPTARALCPTASTGSRSRPRGPIPAATSCPPCSPAATNSRWSTLART